MSGSIPNIAMGFRPTPNVGTVYDPSIQITNAQQLLQFKQQQDQVEQQNALMGLFRDPKSLDATGQPTPETLQKATAIHPEFGLKLRQNMLVNQDHQLKQEYYRSEMAASNADRIAGALAPVVENYKTNLGTMTPEQANQKAAEEYKIAIEGLGNAGFDPNRLKMAPPGWDPVKVPLLVQNSKEFRDWQKSELAKDVDNTKGVQSFKLTSGEMVEFRPFEKDPAKRYTFAGTSNPVPPDKLSGAVKVTGGTGGAGSAATQDRAAIARVAQADLEQQLGRPLNLNDPKDKTELDKRILAAETAQKAANAGATAGARQAAAPSVSQQDKADDNKIAAFEQTAPEDRTPRMTDDYNAAIARRKAEADRKAGVAGATTAAREGASLKGQDHAAIEDDVRRDHPEFTPGQIATEAKAREKLASTLPGSVAADRAGIAKDVETDPAFKDKTAGQKGAEVEHRYQVARTATMDPEVATNLAKQYVATGNVNVFSGFRRNTQMMNQIEKAVIAEQDRLGKTPEQIARSSADFAAYTQGIKAFEAGGRLEPVVRSQNVAVQHLAVLQEAADALKNKDVQLLNKIGNRWTQETGGPAPTDFEGVKRIVGTELVKAITGSAGALGDREALDADLKTANSPEQLTSLINRYKQLMAGQLSGLRQSYDRLDTGQSFAERFLAPTTQREIAKYAPPGGGGAQQNPAGRVPSITNDEAGRNAFEALPPGAEYTFNGQQRRKQGQPAQQQPATQTQQQPAPQAGFAPLSDNPAAPKVAPTSTPQQGSQASPIKAAPGMKEADLVDGKWYENGGRVARWDAKQKKFFPAGGQ